MFSQAWKKYLPVIIILLKRSATGDQTLKLSGSDFERAAGGRKMKYSFNHLTFVNGRLNSLTKQLPFAKELAYLLQNDPVASQLLKDKEFEFSMGNDFNLMIKNLSDTVVPEEQAATVVESEEEPVTADGTEEETTEEN
ncbi:MAG: hypothetical protein JWQ27_2470 [Ferruginibacter sp.]|nr:hypothetical protein [Ferruginibacter sp.]